MYKLFNYSKWDGKGGFSKKFYNKKIQLFLLLIVLAWFSAESNVIFYFLLFICGLYSIKTFLRAQKKGLGVSSAVLVVIIKPLLDFCQTAGFINGKITGIK
jgi:uncharacterized membrane protein